MSCVPVFGWKENFPRKVCRSGLGGSQVRIAFRSTASLMFLGVSSLRLTGRLIFKLDSPVQT